MKKNPPEGAVLPYDHWVSRVEPSNHDVNVCYVTYSGYRSHTEDTSYIYVTRDMGETWEDLSAGMMNPVNDINEDPDNPNVLYIGTDYGVFVSIDSGKNWTNISEDAPDVIIMDMDIQERERDLALATYGRGFYIIDIYPFKEFSPEVFEKDAYLFDMQRVVKWTTERRGQSYGEFAVSPNPRIEASIYYHIKTEAKSVKLAIKDLEGNLLQEVRGKGEPGLHKAVWNLRQRRTQSSGNQQQFRRGGPSLVEEGTYKVTLIVDDNEVVTKKFKVVDDPILK